MAQPEPRVEETAPAAGAAPMVRLESVKKSFGDLVVLDGIDLTVDQGEVLVVIGPWERKEHAAPLCQPARADRLRADLPRR